MKTRNDKIYEKGVHEGQDGGFVEDVVEAACRLFPILPRDESDKIHDSGYDYGAMHRRKNNHYDDIPDNKEGDCGESNNEFNIGEVVVFIIIAYFVYWFLWGH